MKVPNTIATLLVGILLTLFSVWYGQNNGLLPVDASIEAGKIDQLFNAMMAIATGLFLLIQGALIYSAIVFRRKAGDDTDAEPIDGNVPLEILWTAIPAAIVMWLAIYSLDIYSAVNSGGYVGPNHMAHAHTQEVAYSSGDAIAAPLDGETPSAVGAMPEDPNRPFKVSVNGMQYAWIFTYPDTGIVSGELHVPVDRTVDLDIAATDVIHAFWVPEFRLKQDAVPGQETHLRFTPNKVGEYPVICAELCGPYHGAMRTRTIVHSADDYQAWEASQRMAASQGGTAIATRPDSMNPPEPSDMGMTHQERLMAHAHQHHMPKHLSDIPQVSQSAPLLPSA